MMADTMADMVADIVAELGVHPEDEVVGQKYIHFHWKLFISNIFVM